MPLLVAAVPDRAPFAPTRLRFTGAVLGLFAGAMAALVYTLHCPELSPAFLVVWYSLGMLIPAAVGCRAGRAPCYAGKARADLRSRFSRHFFWRHLFARTPIPTGLRARFIKIDFGQVDLSPY